MRGNYVTEIKKLIFYMDLRDKQVQGITKVWGNEAEPLVGLISDAA